MNRTLQAAALILTCAALAPSCLLDAGPYESAGGAGTTTTTSHSGGTGGGATTGGGGDTGGAPPANCGDGKKDVDEECDLGPQNSDTGDCTTKCKNAACGDGFVHAGKEECDEGSANSDTGQCTSKCTNAVCGDGFVEAGQEECDQGPKNADTAACTSKCKNAVCGDGFVEMGVEDCEDGNTDDGDGCSAQCHTVCGDGIVLAPETCEDGNANSGDGCSATCGIEVGTCGNGRVDPDEICDPTGGDCTDCTQINAAKTCGKADAITPGAPDGAGVRHTTFEDDTTVNPAPDGDLLNPTCADPHNGRLLTYKTGDFGSIVFFQTLPGDVGGLPTFNDTTLWVYRDCLGKKGEEACDDGLTYSSLVTGYLPPHTTLYVVVGGFDASQKGKFILDVTEQPVKLLFGTTFDSDLATLATSDVGGDGATWKYCNGGGCGANTTASWSGKGYALIADASGLNLGGETLSKIGLDATGLSSVFVQFSFDFSQKGGGADETFAFQDADDGQTWFAINPFPIITPPTPSQRRQILDVSGEASSTYGIQFNYNDVGGQGDFAKVDDLYVYGY